MTLLRHIFLGLGIFCLLYAPLSAQAVAGGPSSALEPLKAWVGKYPFEKIKGQTLWDQAPFQKVLQILLGPDRFETLMQKWMTGPTEPVQLVDDVLVLSLCKPHACMTDYVRLFVNYKTRDVAACWSETDDKGASIPDVWLSSLQKGPQIAVNGCDSARGITLYNAYGVTP